MKDIKDKNILFFGVGAVGKCNLHYIDKYFLIDYNKLLLIDKIDYRTHPDVKKAMDKGAKYLICDINKEYENIIKNLNEYDIILDFTNRTDTIKITECALKYNIHILNSSLEDPISPNELNKKEEKLKTTYQASHNEINTLKAKYKDRASSLMCAGTNPGLITIFHKLGLMFLAKKQKKTEDLNLYIREKDWGRLCKYLKVKIMHCSETDSAEWTSKNENKNKYCNTWSVQAMVDELSDRLQLIWSTDDKKAPKKSEMLTDHVINLNEPSYKFYSESYVPKVGKFIGVNISHSEQISGGDWFSTPDYSPYMYYVYRLSPITYNTTLKKLNKNLMGGTFKPNTTHVINNYDDKFDGEDIVGSLIISENNKTVWCGSILDNKAHHIGYNSATTSQVSIGCMSFLTWILDNPKKGVNFVEVCDEQYIFNLMKPYIGFYCDFVDYKPNSFQFADLQKTKQDYDKQF